MLWKFLCYKLFTPNHQEFSQILALAITERLKSVFLGNIFFLLGECRTYFYSSNSNILAGCIQVWFSVLQFCLSCSESFCSRYLGLCMTQRSCFLLNICLCLLLRFQLFLFSHFRHLKSSSFISILCLGESYLLHCFHLSSLFSAFLRVLEFVQCTSDLIFHNAYSILGCYSILPCYFILGSPKVLSHSGISLLISSNVFQYDFLLLFYEEETSCILLLMIWFSNYLLFTGRNHSLRFAPPLSLKLILSSFVVHNF